MPSGPFSPFGPYGREFREAMPFRPLLWRLAMPSGPFRPSLPQTFLPFSHGTLRTNTDSQDRDSTPDNAQSYLFPKYFGGKFGGVSVPRVSSDVFVVTGSEVGHFSGLEIEGCRKDFSWKVWWTRDFVVTLQTNLDVL